MIKQVTVTLTVPADRLADLQAFCMEQDVVDPRPATPSPPEPKPQRKKRSKKASADTKEARQTEAKAEAPKEPETKLTLDDVRAALRACVKAKQTEAAQKVLTDHGADSLPQLKPAQFADVIRDLEALVA